MRSAIYFVIQNKNRKQAGQNVNKGISGKGMWIFTVLFLQLTCEFNIFCAGFLATLAKIAQEVFMTILLVVSSKYYIKLCRHARIQICRYPWWMVVIFLIQLLFHLLQPYLLLEPTPPCLGSWGLDVGVWTTSICSWGSVGACVQLVQTKPMDINPRALAGPMG